MSKLIELDKVLEILNDDTLTNDSTYRDYLKLLVWKLPTTETTWIPVEERLPEEGVEVLTNYKGLYFWLAHIEGDLGWVDNEYNKNSVSHWQPLPQPPKL